MNLDNYIRKFPNFPKQGVLYYDITNVLTKPDVFRQVVDRMLELYKDIEFDAVAGIESRGFIFATAFALRREIPQILVRKAGKLPGVTLKKAYQLEYGKAEVEVHLADVTKGARILLVDDLIATGGTMKAAYELLNEAGASVRHAFGMIGLPFLNFAEAVPDLQLQTLINYHSETI
ncbi:adenine phosphoribosyltransferase [Candidatus Haliotispira prima]|uniref:Adenine phosphoribosyltransferase n=1 Tax=Candidatus Haliotispira prima TaxID=3034016 RepID=A0ABY8ME99_9SPIO|nr:adenine phosphoribosyltransferase [Candidatus Haliotispira prima]